MKNVTIYSTQYCPYCTRVKMLFKDKGVSFEEVDLTDDPEKRQELSQKTGWMTVPMVFIGDEFIGGYDETAELESKGELDLKLADS